MTWNYIAGFFDGEGSITHNGKGFRVTISQTNQVVLENIKKFVSYGNIIYEKRRKEHWKDSWVYYIAKQEEVCNFLIEIEPFLVVKKVLAKKSIAQLKKIVRIQKNKKNKLSRRIVQIKKMRNKGLTYRQIGKNICIDFGHARKLFMNHRNDKIS